MSWKAYIIPVINELDALKIENKFSGWKIPATLDAIGILKVDWRSYKKGDYIALFTIDRHLDDLPGLCAEQYAITKADASKFEWLEEKQ